MTRIDFYQLTAPQHSHDRVVCQLCQKAWENNQYTLLLTQDAQQTAHLDRQLWVFDDDSFVPHDARESAEFKAGQRHGMRSLPVTRERSVSPSCSSLRNECSELVSKRSFSSQFRLR